MSEANGTLGPTSPQFLSLKATHILTIIVARFQRAPNRFHLNLGFRRKTAPPQALMCVAVGDKNIAFEPKS